jgi:hypothetical protein
MEPGDRVLVDWDFDQIEAEMTDSPSQGKISIKLDSGEEISVPAETVHSLPDSTES